MSPHTEAAPPPPVGALDDLASLTIPSDQLSRGPAGGLEVDACDAFGLVHEYGSPLYVISERTLRANYRRLHRGLADRWPGSFKILYAIKANNNLAIRAIMHDEGAGGDCFGEGELYATFAGGADPECVVLNGSNKAHGDLRAAVELGVRVNVDGEDEIGQLAEIASEVDRTARVNIRLRVIPAAVADRSSDYIGAGVPSAEKILGGQWGFSVDKAAGLIERIRNTRGLELEGFHHHIGRLMPDPAYYRSSAECLVEAVGELYTRTGFRPCLLDIGGGLARERDPEVAPAGAQSDPGRAVSRRDRRAAPGGIRIAWPAVAAAVARAGALSRRQRRGTCSRPSARSSAIMVALGCTSMPPSTTSCAPRRPVAVTTSCQRKREPTEHPSLSTWSDRCAPAARSRATASCLSFDVGRSSHFSMPACTPRQRRRS